LHALAAIRFREALLQGLRPFHLADGAPVADLPLTPLVSRPIPFDEALAYVAASRHERTRDHGLSFGDCACLALTRSLDLPAVTAEQEWDKVDVGVRVIKIREKR
jgi:PIN domain nuclease of toxin-antitoxin system